MKNKYGLPLDVKFCKSCVLSNQRPSSCVEFKSKPGVEKRPVKFNDDGECEACKYTKKKKEINWDEREKELLDLLDRFRSKDGAYDVVVPGSGGKDSVIAAYLLKYKYKMNPLLVTWPPHIYTPMGKRNMDSWLNAGFDNISYTPNQRVHRLLTKLAFENLVHPFQPFIIGQKNIAPKFSVLYNIPLVFYGENEAEYGNAIKNNNSSKRDSFYYSSEEKLDDIYLGGVSAKDLMKEYNVSRSDLEAYLPVNPYDLERVGTEVHYLGYYVKWDPQECYYFSVENTDFLPNDQRTQGSFNKYSSIDDKMDWLHFYTTYVKFGIGRATYDASQEIRNGHITRDEAVRLVHRFDGEFPTQYLQENLDYMGITLDRFYEIIDNARPDHLWDKQNGEWLLKNKVK